MKRYINIALTIGILLFIYSFVNFSLNQLWDWVSTVSLILGILISAVALYYRYQMREKELNLRFVKYGANTLLSALIVLGILVLIAFITNRHNARADLTAQGLYSLAEQTRAGLVFTPAVDIFENEKQIVLLADMPGVKAKGLNIDLRDDTLTLDGDVEPIETEGEENVLIEYGVGKYYRQFSLSEMIDQEKIDAQLMDGVLLLKLPKVEAATPRKITVKAS